MTMGIGNLFPLVIRKKNIPREFSISLQSYSVGPTNKRLKNIHNDCFQWAFFQLFSLKNALLQWLVYNLNVLNITACPKECVCNIPFTELLVKWIKMDNF